MRKALLILVPAILLGLVYTLTGSSEPPPQNTQAGPTARSAAPRTGSLVEPAALATIEASEPDRAGLRREEATDVGDATLSGIVVDEVGEPVLGISLGATPDTGFGGSANSKLTGADGRFLIARGESKSLRASIRIRSASRSGFEVVSEPQLYEWGTEGIRIVVRSPTTWLLSVVEADTGRPVEDFDWRCRPKRGTGRQRGWNWHEDGMVRIPRLEYGEHRVEVFPASKDLVPASVGFDVNAEAGEIRVELQRRRPLIVRVLRGDGNPVHGTVVELLRKESDGELRLDSLTAPAEMSSSQRRAASILDSGETDAWGEVVLQGPPHEGLVLKALGPGHAPRLVSGVRIVDEVRPVVLPVFTGATLVGTIEPPSVRTRLMSTPDLEVGPATPVSQRPSPHLSLIRRSRSGQETYRDPRNGIVRLDEDGSFRIDEVPAGTWEVQLTYFTLSRGPSPGPDPQISIGARRTLSLAEVTLKDGETRYLTLDVSALIPGRITGQIYLDGKPYANGHLSLHGESVGQVHWFGTLLRNGLTTDADGRFTTEADAGAVGVALIPDPQRPSRQIISTERVQVLPAQTSIGVFRFVHRRMRVRFLEHDGTPATERYFSVFRHSWRNLRTDADGWLALDPAPAEPVSFHTWPKRMNDTVALSRLSSGEERGQLQVTLGPVQLPAGAVEGEFTLRLPPDGD